MRSFFILFFVLTSLQVLLAQPRPAQTTIYPNRLYPGENVITITNEGGIDKIRPRPSSNTVVQMPTIRGCPTTVTVRVRVNNATTGESVDFTVYDCAGTFSTQTATAENWTIRREFTGPVEIGKDTCIICEVVTTDEKVIDSIVVNNPRFTVMMPSGGAPWHAVGSSLNYRICYRPEVVETINDTIRLYVRRGQPNGGLTHYTITKPILATAVPPAPPPPVEPDPIDTLPPLEDPTTFRNIVMPTAESLGEGRFFLGNYDLAGWMAGYGFTDQFTGILGVVAVPDVISRVLVATVGGKYEVVQEDEVRFAVGFQYSLSSTEESDITVAAPFAIFSLGNRARRLSISGGYGWKHHKQENQEFDRNAYVLAIGGDYTIARGWKVAAETYVVESSGIAPVVGTVRWFSDRFAFDAGLLVDVAGGTDVRGTSTLSGEVRKLALAPVLSFVWKW